jgi:hypothetical protein
VRQSTPDVRGARFNQCVAVAGWTPRVIPNFLRNRTVSDRRSWTVDLPGCDRREYAAGPPRHRRAPHHRDDGTATTAPRRRRLVPRRPSPPDPTPSLRRHRIPRRPSPPPDPTPSLRRRFGEPVVVTEAGCRAQRARTGHAGTGWMAVDYRSRALSARVGGRAQDQTLTAKPRNGTQVAHQHQALLTRAHATTHPRRRVCGKTRRSPRCCATARQPHTNSNASHPCSRHYRPTSVGGRKRRRSPRCCSTARRRTPTATPSHPATRPRRQVGGR